MVRLIFWALVGVVMLWLVRGFGSRAREERAERLEQKEKGKPGDGAQAPAKGQEWMVQCAVCQVHLPSSEAKFGGGRAYCCEEHRRQES